MSRLYDLQETVYDPIVHNSTADLDEKLTQVLVKSLEWEYKITIEIFYKNVAVFRSYASYKRQNALFDFSLGF